MGLFVADGFETMGLFVADGFVADRLQMGLFAVGHAGEGEKRLPAVVPVANMVEAGRCLNLRGIIMYFVLIFIFCNFLKLLMCQLMRGWQKTPVFCKLRIAAALE
jgi:hypothetical protein